MVLVDVLLMEREMERPKPIIPPLQIPDNETRIVIWEEPLRINVYVGGKYVSLLYN